MRLAAAKPREPPRALPLDQRLQRLPQKGRGLPHAGQVASLLHQIVVEGEGDAHTRNLAPICGGFHLLMGGQMMPA